MSYFGTYFDLEDTSQYKYILINNDTVWYIGKPEKDILFLPAGNEHALYTDTSQYYRSNVTASFQFRLRLFSGVVCCFDFSHKYDFEPNKDGSILETSYDNGTTWQNIVDDPYIMDNPNEIYGLYTSQDTVAVYNYKPGFTGLYSEGGECGICWLNNVNNDTLLIRFTFASDSFDAGNEGWMLDYFYFWTMIWDPVHESSELSDVKLFPNPSTDQLTIQAPYSTFSRFEVYSVAGDLLLKREGHDMQTVDVSSLEPGIYLLRCYGPAAKPQTFKFRKL
jgi:hypothetical protein